MFEVLHSTKREHFHAFDTFYSYEGLFYSGIRFVILASVLILLFKKRRAIYLNWKVFTLFERRIIIVLGIAIPLITLILLWDSDFLDRNGGAEFIVFALAYTILVNAIGWIARARRKVERVNLGIKGRLKELEELKRDGLIDSEDYIKKRKEIIGEL